MPKRMSTRSTALPIAKNVTEDTAKPAVKTAVKTNGQSSGMLSAFMLLLCVNRGACSLDAPSSAEANIKEWPPMDDRPQLDAVARRNIDDSVAALIAHLGSFGYHLTTEEMLALSRRDKNGNVEATFVLHGFPVNASQPWLDPSGKALAVRSQLWNVAAHAQSHLGCPTLNAAELDDHLGYAAGFPRLARRWWTLRPDRCLARCCSLGRVPQEGTRQNLCLCRG